MRLTSALLLLIACVGCGTKHSVPAPAPLRRTVIEDDSRASAPQRADSTRSTEASPSGTAESTNHSTPSPDEVLKPINRILEDAFFDFDRYHLRADATDSLRKDADLLKEVLHTNPALQLIVEGHCDELGSAEYNLGLGEQRAEAARQFLTALGIPADRMRTISFGKEHPICTDSTEDCRQRNRRAHLDYVR